MSRENQVMETKKIKECAYLRSVRWTCPLLCSSAGRRHGGSFECSPVEPSLDHFATCPSRIPVS